jgi:hypothetical protein
MVAGWLIGRQVDAPIQEALASKGCLTLPA